MNKKPPKPEIDFNEALRRIANTPKAVIDAALKEPKKDKKQGTQKAPVSGGRKAT